MSVEKFSIVTDAVSLGRTITTIRARRWAPMGEWADYWCGHGLNDRWEDAPTSIFVTPDDDELLEGIDNEITEEDNSDYGAWLGNGERSVPNRPEDSSRVGPDSDGP